MTRDDWARAKSIVEGALSRTGAERADYLARQCGPDSAMRGEVESLLAATVRAADLYEGPTLLIAGARAALEALGDAAPLYLDSARADDDPLAAPTGDMFPGTERYAVHRQIGVGGMGVVYEVEDRTRGQMVALKTLRRWNAADVSRLKREFRSLADIAHPNLASLYDLVVDDRQCFFTMELVDGVTFVEFVRHSRSNSADVDRIRRALPQLIEGLLELHRRGKLHRDIKPSNVQVTPEGRVVILDFGLTSNLDRAEITRESGLAGTPAYLSPEQCRGLDLSAASDWYCVGLTLYHALTGRLPFDGSLSELVRRKTMEDPQPPSALTAGIPDDLNDVCMAMLRREPETRMSGREALGRMRATASHATSVEERVPESVFVGREYYLDVLGAAFRAVKGGRSASVYIHGPSGIGKSALVQCFLDRHLKGQAFAAFRGRCYEHESVPYKGLDGVVDGLSQYLRALPRAEAAQLLPRDVGALTRLFPEMQVSGVTTAPGLEQDTADPVAIRRRGLAALRELLGRVATRQPLVLEIDDFQWADPDSAMSLTELLLPPNPPSLLLLVSFRSEEIDAKPFLRALIERVDPATRVALPLAPLTEDEVGRLIATLLPSESRPADDDRREIAREAGGNPFLVEELTRYAALGPGAHRGATLEDMLKRRLESLPSESRAFLETLAVCGRPIMPARLFEACGFAGDERPLVARLRSARFVRTSRSADRVEMYHDRIRDALTAQVPQGAARRIHELMARILVVRGDDDPEALFDHYQAAGHDTLAAGQAAAAAAKASAVLAFDRAAAFYRHALALQPHADRDVRAGWSAGLARSLENAGRPAEAADAYLDAARAANDRQRVEWLRKAAEQLLIGGHIDRGLDTVRIVLRTTGMRLARGPTTALASMLLRRAQLGWRGLEFVERDEAQIPQAELLRIDACWSVTTGLAMVDNIRAAAFHTRQLLIALETGEPYRVARALALEAAFSALSGQAGIARSAAFVERAKVMAERVGHPHAIALSSLTAGIAALVRGHFRQATVLCERALTILRDECSGGVTWELNLAHNFFLGSLLFRGELRDVSRVLPGLLRTARERGNLYFDTELRTRMNLVWLAADEPDEGERQANDAIGRWSHRGFHRQHYNHLLARVQTALYRNQPRDAWRLVADHRTPLERTLWLRVQFLRIETAFLRARSALAMAAGGHDAKRMRAVAARDAARIAREDMPWSNPLAMLVRATLANLEGDEGAAAVQLGDAVDAFDSAEMHLYAAAARRRLATVVGGDRGRALRAQADEWMAAQEIRNPTAMTRLLAPGFTPRSHS